MEKVTFSNWDIKDHLKSSADINAYIKVAAEEGTPDALPDAFSDVFRALGHEDEASACAGLAEYLRSTSVRNMSQKSKRVRKAAFARA